MDSDDRRYEKVGVLILRWSEEVHGDLNLDDEVGLSNPVRKRPEQS